MPGFLVLYIHIMSIKIPYCDMIDWSCIDKSDLDLAKSVDIQQDFLSAVQREITSRFLYEPINDETISRIKDSVTHAVQGYYQGAAIQSINIDDMRDLEFKRKECRECAETSSYEEYQIKRAAQNLPDEAGSEREWSRMSQYKPGQINMNISYIPVQPIPMQQVECTIELVTP